MTESDTIVCKPTRWFLLRAWVMLLMFGAFAVLFFMDGTSGYRNKNEVFYLHRTFQTANTKFTERNQGGALTPEAWKNFAASQTVDFEPDHPLPARLTVPMAWPEILHDYGRMQSLNWNLLWREYTKARGINETVPEEPYDARKINEQWVVFWICAALAITISFFLLRTLRRSIVADAEALTDQRGRRVAYADMQFLDLRKWETKGLAFVAYAGESGSGRIRLDGLTYGGFRKEDGEPAERLMQRLRSRFSGEVMEYAVVDSTTPAATGADTETGL
ncbi:MAG: hypothetical protein WCJ66_12785 [Verrucomicrobiota bacterium]